MFGQSAEPPPGAAGAFPGAGLAAAGCVVVVLPSVWAKATAAVPPTIAPVKAAAAIACFHRRVIVHLLSSSGLEPSPSSVVSSLTVHGPPQDPPAPALELAPNLDVILS